MTTEEQRSAIQRLIEIAQSDTGQSRRCADFLLACHNAGSNGGWDPIDLWDVDIAIGDDMMTVLGLIRRERRDLQDHGFRAQLRALHTQWRKPAAAAVAKVTTVTKLTDYELSQLISEAVNEREERRHTATRAADLERRRAAIRRGEGDPGPGRG